MIMISCPGGFRKEYQGLRKLENDSTKPEEVPSRASQGFVRSFSLCLAGLFDRFGAPDFLDLDRRVPP